MSCTAETVLDYNLMIHIIPLLLNQQCWYKNNITFRIWFVLLSPASCPKPWNWQYVDEIKIPDPHLIYSIWPGSVFFNLHFLELPLWWLHSTSLSSPPSATMAQRSHVDILRQKWETPCHCWLLRHFPSPSFRCSANINRAVPTRHVSIIEKYNMTCYIVMINCIRARRNKIALKCRANPTHTKVKWRSKFETKAT